MINTDSLNLTSLAINRNFYAVPHPTLCDKMNFSDAAFAAQELPQTGRGHRVSQQTAGLEEHSKRSLIVSSATSI